MQIQTRSWLSCRPVLFAVALSALVACAGPAAGEPPAGAPSRDPAAQGPADSSPGAYAYTTARTGDVHDFDFIAGAWTLQNRRLKARWAGSHDWDEFPAVDCG
ncbi:MAG TPA: hypothetical protein VFT22_33155, partial [Kofleriaceae bacterium]|nr:hypothetical protein [Kofleriaceae bacterium]